MDVVPARLFAPRLAGEATAYAAAGRGAGGAAGSDHEEEQ
jgi:hypothetical protein